MDEMAGKLGTFMGKTVVGWAGGPGTVSRIRPIELENFLEVPETGRGTRALLATIGKK